MTVLIILLIIICLVLLSSIYSRTGKNQETLRSLNKRINDLSDQLYQVSHALKEFKGAEKKKSTANEVLPEAIAASPTGMKQPVPEISPDVPLYTPRTNEKVTAPEPVPEEPTNQRTGEQMPSPQFNWRSKNTDLEKFIGENLANKIGIAVLVLGISFFVKYAIDKNWINETGRVLIGIACGSVLIGIAHYIRNRYRSFSSVLVGGGLTVFYFSVAFAFHQYQLIGQQFSFIAMVVITGLAVLLSLFYGRQELAILAAIGGFLTPFFVSTGNENYLALFTYLCILNTGMMALAWFKRWHAINIISLVFTTVIYGGWLARSLIMSEENSFHYRDALLFGTIFYLIFIAMSLVNNLRLGRRFAAFDFIIVLSINFLYYGAGMLVLDYWSEGVYKGLFTILLGLFNLGLAAVFYRKKTIDRSFLALLIGLTLMFISLAAPVQLHGNHVVLFWAAESVVLFCLYQRSKIAQLKYASLGVIILMVLSLLVVWKDIYHSDSGIIAVFFNKGFMTGLVVSAILLVYHLLLKKEKDGEMFIPTIPNQLVKRTMVGGALIIAYITGVLEIFYQFTTRVPATSVYTIYFQLYTFAFAMLVLGLLKRTPVYSLLKLVLTIICFAFYLINLKTNFEVSRYLLTTGPAFHFWAHWLGIGLLGWLLVDFIRFFFLQTGTAWLRYRAEFTWLATVAVVILLSVEMYQVIQWAAYRDREDWAWWENLYYKAGLSIVWGLCSFVMMWLGMRFNFRTLRIISLTLFTVTIIKLFVYDIRRVPPGGKIAAFILLGVLLLTVSFMYQRLKRILIDNQDKERL